MSRLHPNRPPLKTLAYGLGVLGGAGVLAACGHSAPTRFFTLDPVPPASTAATAAYAGPALKVMAVNIPPALDREELVSEEAGGQVRVHDFEHWEAPLGQTARQVLVQDLASRLPSGVVVGPNMPGGASVATLSADVVAFQASAGGATLQAAWSLTLPGVVDAPAALVWRAPIRNYQAAVGGADGGGATAQAFSALLAQLADQIAAEAPAQAAELQSRQLATQAQARAEAEAAAHPRTSTQTRTVSHSQTTSASR